MLFVVGVWEMGVRKGVGQYGSDKHSLSPLWSGKRVKGKGERFEFTLFPLTELYWGVGCRKNKLVFEIRINQVISS
jgi:hypothetical protein